MRNRIVPTLMVAFLMISSAPLLAQTAADEPKQRAASLFEQGQSEHERGNLNRAVRFYNEAIRLDPSLYQAYYQRAGALADQGETTQAESDLRKSISLEPGFARAHRALGLMLLDRGVADEAKRELGKAVELDPKLKFVRPAYAGALIRTGDPVTAILQLKSAIEMGETTAQVYGLLGLAEEHTGKAPEAMADYTKAIELDPKDKTAREGRGRLFEAKGDMDNAIEDSAIAYKTEPSLDLAARLARLYVRAGRAPEALQIYRDLLKHRPDDLGLKLDMIRIMAENGQADDADQQLATLLKAQPRSARLLTFAGDLSFKEKPDLAARYFKTVTEIEPENTSALVQLGASLVRSKQFEEGAQVLGRALSREPDSFQARTNFATALFELKQYPQAAAQFTWIIGKKPSLAVAYYFLAISLDKMGDCPGSLRVYKDFLREADPVTGKKEIDDATIRVSLLQKLVKSGKCKPAGKNRTK